MTIHRRVVLAAVALGVVACSETSGPSNPQVEPSLDAQVRATVSRWGVLPILPVRAGDPAVVDLGRMLFFDKELSGNRDVSCATCHSPITSSGDAQSLAVGTGGIVVNGVRRLGPGRQFTPRNAPSLFNVALGSFYLFWDGRVSEEGGQGRFQTPAGVVLPGGLANLLAAQAMIPVTNRVEMRGLPGDTDAAGNANELATIADSDNAAIWAAVMRRLLSIPAYQQKFKSAFPGVPESSLGFQHAANAIAAFEAQTFTKTNSGFDRFLARDDNAMSVEAKRGALLFFGEARCSTCHSGPMLGQQSFASVGVPQLGPGTGNAAPLDAGREELFGATRPPAQPFAFRIASLRNVELTAPYFHNGAYPTLEAVVRHYNNVDSAMKAYDPSQLDPAIRPTYHGESATINKLLDALDGRLRGAPIGLTPDEQKDLVAFLKSLTDPSARDMSAVVPASVPSGLPVK